MDWLPVIPSAALAGWAGRELWRGWRSRRWLAVPGQIVAFVSREERGTKGRPAPRATSWAGQARTSWMSVRQAIRRSTGAHDSAAYTQGLVWADSVLFESTGLYGHSDVRRVDLRSGRVLASRALPADRFGEGLALLKGRLYQLTWKAGVAYTYDAATLAPGDSFRYPGEGWGLATDGTSLIMSDGSDSLRVLSPGTFQVQRVVHVHYNGAPLYQLNELEYVNGEVLANVYQSNWVLRIDPATGDVREAIDFADLYPERPASVDVMNGIALAPGGQQLLLTGKLWPVLFQVRLRSSTTLAPTSSSILSQR